MVLELSWATATVCAVERDAVFQFATIAGLDATTTRPTGAIRRAIELADIAGEVALGPVSFDAYVTARSRISIGTAKLTGRIQRSLRKVVPKGKALFS